MSFITILTQAATTVGVSPALLLSVCFQESSLRNVIVPHDGNSASWGICQVKLTTAREQLKTHIYPSHLLNPSVNAKAAATYLKKQIKRYNGNVWCGVNAYNAGTTRNCTKNINTEYVNKVKTHMRRQPWKN